MRLAHWRRSLGVVGLLGMLAGPVVGQALSEPAAPQFAEALDRDAQFDALLARLAESEARLEALEAERAARPLQFAGLEAADPSPETAAAQPVDRQEFAALEKKWEDFTKSQKKLPSLKVNGAFQADTVFFHQDDENLATFGRIQNGAGFRRARLSASGSVTDTVNYFLQMDFAFFGRPTFTDLWIEQTELPIFGTVRIGQWKQPASLEVASSYRYTTFMERSLLFQPFDAFRRLGIGFYNVNEAETMTWAASVFASGQDQFGDSLGTDGNIGAAERLTLLPYYDEQSNGRYYLHLGGHHFFNHPAREVANFRTIPEIFVGEFASSPGNPVGTSGQAVPNVLNGTPFFVATGPLAVNHYNVVGTELLWVEGAFSLQAETAVSFVDLASGDNAVLCGFYAQAGYFLTGEHRPYNRKVGAIDRVMPFEDFFRVRGSNGVCSGKGAWEVAARLSYLDLNDQTIHGGQLTDFTFGVNWYWNPYTKIVFNYIHPFVNSSAGIPAGSPGGVNSEADIFAMRAQVDF